MDNATHSRKNDLAAMGARKWFAKLGQSVVLVLGHYFEILRPVVALVSIFVMNDLAPLQKSAKMLFHYRSMLHHIPRLRGLRVHWHQQ